MRTIKIYPVKPISVIYLFLPALLFAFFLLTVYGFGIISDHFFLFFQKVFQHFRFYAVENVPLLALMLGTSVLIIFGLEFFFPADPKKKIIDIHVSQDILWFFINEIFAITVLFFYLRWVYNIYNQHFSFLTIPIGNHLPVPVQFILSVLLVDYLKWITHWFQHKIPWLWNLHILHHSQEKLNLFTNYRIHPLGYLYMNVVNATPLLILGLDPPYILAFHWYHLFHNCLVHSNVKTNLGWLHYILVTPQSHRLHHSLEEKYHDKNFGVLFSFWDRLFGTYHPPISEPYDLGIQNRDFPYERNVKPSALIQISLRQFMYSLYLFKLPHFPAFESKK